MSLIYPLDYTRKYADKHGYYLLTGQLATRPFFQLPLIGTNCYNKRQLGDSPGYMETDFFALPSLTQGIAIIWIKNVDKNSGE